MRHQHGLSRPLFATLICAAALAASASEFIVDFNPASPANTNGWDLGATTTNWTKSGTQPGGRKFNPAEKGETIAIESPVFSADIRSVALKAWGNNINNGNASIVSVWGRAGADEPYASVFSRTGLANTVAVNAPLDKFSVSAGASVRQLKIGYTKDIGTWILATVTITDASETDGSETGGDDLGDDETDGDEDGAAELAAPGNVRAGLLPDGRVRLGWTTPDGATNVGLRVWTLAGEGGLAAAAADDILWRESFANAPATNSTVAVSDNSKFDLYADNGSEGWDSMRSVQVSLSADVSAIKIGTGDKFGALVSQVLDLSSEDLSLVVRAKHYGTNPTVILHTATLSPSSSEAADPAAVTTNDLGQARLGADFAEHAFPIKESPAGNAALLIESMRGTSNDRRIIIDDIALVRGYSPVSTATNEVMTADLGATEEYDLAADDAGSVRYATLCAQDATGATSEWTEPLILDPNMLGEWTPRYLTPDRRGKVDATFDPAALPDATDASLDVSDSPFRFLLDGNERLTISRNKDATKSFSAGVYVCTNVFERDWLVLTPYAAETLSDVKTAELRVAIESGDFSLRKVTLSGEFAQLGASNDVARTLQFQWRTVAANGAATEWQDFGEYVTTCTATDAPGDLRETVREVVAEATPRTSAGARLKAGARVEVRILNERRKGQKEAPLGFRNFSVRAESADRAILFVIR